MKKEIELVHVKQEQDEEGFDGIIDNYRFNGVPIVMTRGFYHTFEEEYNLIVLEAIIMILEDNDQKERIQRFVYQEESFWVISNWEVGTEATDYINPEELCVTFLLPCEY